MAVTSPPEPSRDLLIRCLAELGNPTSDDRIDALLRYTDLLADWSQRMNLTAHRSPDAIVRRLLLDAAALGHQFGPVSSLADVGSGAGLPGIPLAIFWPECRVTLIEPRRKRHHFQRAVVRELALPNVEAKLGRSEDLEAEPHAAAVAQALAAPHQALEWMLPWVEVGGLAVLPGSERPAEVPERPDVVDVERRTYRVPGGGVERTVWMGRRAC